MTFCIGWGKLMPRGIAKACQIAEGKKKKSKNPNSFGLFFFPSLFVLKPLKLLADGQEIWEVPLKSLARCLVQRTRVSNLCCWGFDDSDGRVGVRVYTGVPLLLQVAQFVLAACWSPEDEARGRDKHRDIAPLKTRRFCPGSSSACSSWWECVKGGGFFGLHRGLASRVGVGEWALWGLYAEPTSPPRPPLSL